LKLEFNLYLDFFEGDTAMKNKIYGTNILLITLIGLTLVAFSPRSWSQEIKGGHEASPDIYKVLAENEMMRVILAIWEPGARDNWHGHPATAVYYVTDCHVRAFFPDGSSRDIQRIGGTGRARSRPVTSHSIQNIGNEQCHILLVEVLTEK
jgi:hypothetical protein